MNEKGGILVSLKEDGTVDLDSKLRAIIEWLSTKMMIHTWLGEAIVYELQVCSDGSSAKKIYCSDLLWPIGMILHFKQTDAVQQLLKITKDNAEQGQDEYMHSVSSLTVNKERLYKGIL